MLQTTITEHRKQQVSLLWRAERIIALLVPSIVAQARRTKMNYVFIRIFFKHLPFVYIY